MKVTTDTGYRKRRSKVSKHANLSLGASYISETVKYVTISLRNSEDETKFRIWGISSENARKLAGDLNHYADWLDNADLRK